MVQLTSDCDASELRKQSTSVRGCPGPCAHIVTHLVTRQSLARPAVAQRRRHAFHIHLPPPAGAVGVFRS
jgi:hypothetical protein